MAGGANFTSFIRDGRIVGLAVDGPTRSALYPQVPTLSELGYTEKLNRNYAGLVVPAATADSIVARLHGAVTAIMSEPAFRQQHLLDRALEPIGNTSEEFARFLDIDRKTFEQVVTEGKIGRQ